VGIYKEKRQKESTYQHEDSTAMHIWWNSKTFIS